MVILLWGRESPVGLKDFEKIVLALKKNIESIFPFPRSIPCTLVHQFTVLLILE